MKLFIVSKAKKQLDKIPDPIAKTIADDLLSLSSNPYPPNSKKLQGEDNYRLRIGSFRAIYTIDKKKKEIVILRIADRKTVYR
jgi:mRNA interferase RelE/StbE